MENWGSRLSRLLERKNLTQVEIAARVGVSPAAVNKWTAGCGIRYINLRSLADHLGVNWIWLRYGSSGFDDHRGARAMVEHVMPPTDSLTTVALNWVQISTCG